MVVVGLGDSRTQLAPLIVITAHRPASALYTFG
jgi:hypothetical protein